MASRPSPLLPATSGNRARCRRWPRSSAAPEVRPANASTQTWKLSGSASSFESAGKAARKRRQPRAVDEAQRRSANSRLFDPVGGGCGNRLPSAVHANPPRGPGHAPQTRPRTPTRSGGLGPTRRRRMTPATAQPIPQKAFRTPAKNPRRAPYCGAPTPTPDPSRSR